MFALVCANRQASVPSEALERSTVRAGGLLSPPHPPHPPLVSTPTVLLLGCVHGSRNRFSYGV
eukprot:366189-Chlamydomonas_euryale.AAC.1